MTLIDWLKSKRTTARQESFVEQRYHSASRELKTIMGLCSWDEHVVMHLWLQGTYVVGQRLDDKCTRLLDRGLGNRHLDVNIIKKGTLEKISSACDICTCKAAVSEALHNIPRLSRF